LSDYGGKSYIRDYALIQGINLLMNIIKRLQDDIIKLQGVFGEWNETSIISYENQVLLIFGTSANDKSCQYLVDCLSELNNHKLSEFPHKQYLLKLTTESLFAIMNAIKAHSHIWNRVQLQTLTSALGTSHVVKAKGLPYYEPDDKEDEEERYMLEYKGE